MSFMLPDVRHGAYFAIETTYAGTVILPVGVLDVGVQPTPDNLSPFMPILGSNERPETWVIERRTGWYGRLSAPGYLDCTDWESADTEEDLLASLRGDDGPDDDEDSDDEPYDRAMRHESAIGETYRLSIDDANADGALYCGTREQVERFLSDLGATIHPRNPGEDWERVTTADGAELGQIDDVRDGESGFSSLHEPIAPLLDALFAKPAPHGWDTIESPDIPNLDAMDADELRGYTDRLADPENHPDLPDDIRATLIGYASLRIVAIGHRTAGRIVTAELVERDLEARYSTLHPAYRW